MARVRDSLNRKPPIGFHKDNALINLSPKDWQKSVEVRPTIINP